jgi:hypothetical protein
VAAAAAVRVVAAVARKVVAQKVAVQRARVSEQLATRNNVQDTAQEARCLGARSEKRYRHQPREVERSSKSSPAHSRVVRLEVAQE